MLMKKMMVVFIVFKVFVIQMFYVLELLDIEAEDRFGSDSSESGENAKLEKMLIAIASQYNNST